MSDNTIAANLPAEGQEQYGAFELKSFIKNITALG